MGYTDPDRGAAAANRREINRHMKREEQAAAEVTRRERALTTDVLAHLSRENPGAVATVGVSHVADLSGEPGHVEGVSVNPGSDRNGRLYRRVRVMFTEYGAASDVTEKLDGERIPAGELTPEDIHPSSVGVHTEMIRMGGDIRTLDDLSDAVDGYLTTRWDPEWKQRERVSGTIEDADDY